MGSGQSGMRAAALVAKHHVQIDVVVPVYNKVRLLGEAVGSVVDAAEAHGNAQIWLIDNGSTDGSYELLIDQFGDRAHVLRLMSGTIAAVRNFGASHGTAPIISFIDCDCVIPGDYFARLEAVFDEIAAEATGCTVVLPRTPTWVEAAWNQMHDDGLEGQRTWLNAANFAVRRETFDRIGGFNETLETDEDTEICLRIRQAGGRIVSDRRLAVMHLDNAKTLPSFFRKERWRGLGMFAATSAWSLDRPTTMMVVHLAALVTAAGVIAWGPKPLWTRLAIGLLIAFLVPAVTVLYRRRTSIARFNVAQALILYQLFYLARLNALVIIAWRASRSR